MRLGCVRLNIAILNQPETDETSLGVEAFLDLLIGGDTWDALQTSTFGAAQGVQPYPLTDETGMATEALYPALKYQRPVYTIKG